MSNRSVQPSSTFRSTNNNSLLSSKLSSSTSTSSNKKLANTSNKISIGSLNKDNDPSANKIITIATLTKEDYAKMDRWCDYFESGKDLTDIRYDITWIVMFAKLMKNPKFKRLNDQLKELIKKNRNLKIYPLPSHLTASFMITKASNLKVVFIGQDPYFHYGQAMGLSFSIPHGEEIPSSLDNVFKNMKKYGHIKKTPESGNLWFWAAQGCLMLNAALTVEDGTKEAHLRMWEWFTDYVIQYISQNMDDIIFVLWGGYAYKKISMIDSDRHHTIISSHPSGLSANKPFQNYPAFMQEDTFGKINEILKKTGRTRILWY